MKYISLDLETTGLDPVEDQILQISMVVEDTAIRCPLEELPHFTAFVKHPRISGNTYALGMNGWILDIISGRKTNETGYPILPRYPTADGSWDVQAQAFLTEHFGRARITVAGKNVAGFDIPFLPKELQK